MALTVEGKILKLDKIQNSIHHESEAKYTVFEKNGEKIFQIDTYGSATRKITEKISQSVQFDRKMARYLVNLLVKEFDLWK